MFKLVVLSALLACVAASGLVPLAYSSTILQPASTSISHQASSVVHPSPLHYSAPFSYGYGHYINKRSAPFYGGGYIAHNPYYSTSSYPYFATSYSTPLVTAPIAHTGLYRPLGHLIKKRSAVFGSPLVSSYSYPSYSYPSYITPTTYSSSYPYVSAYGHSPFIRSPIVTPFGTHLIKKRSAPFLAPISTYITPAAVSHQSRIDYKSSPYLTTYASHIGYPGYGYY